MPAAAATAPGTYGTLGWVQRKTNWASPGRALTHPRDMVIPKLLCQKVEWIATPLPTNRLTQPTPARSQPPPVGPPLMCTEINLRQIGGLPRGVEGRSNGFPRASKLTPGETR